MTELRIAIVGTSGSGKTTLGEQAARRLHCPYIDLDALHWEANWTPADPQVFHQRVSQAIQGSAWIVGGNYRAVRDLVWPRANTLVWLDYPLLLVLWRQFWRVLRRVIRQEELWSGNRETWRGQFMSRDSLFLWAIKTHPRHRRDYPRLLALPEYQHLQVHHLKSPRQTQAWLAQLVEPASPLGGERI